MVIAFHGIKNDAKRRGDSITIPMSSNPSVCPVLPLRTYITRTANLRAIQPGNHHVFLALKSPYHGLSVGTISKVLKDVIKSAGLEGYSAKDFRPMGATAAMQAGIPELAVKKIGRWHSFHFFMEHNVQVHETQDYTDKFLGTK